MGLRLNKSSTQWCICQVWLKFTQWFCRRRFLSAINVFSLLFPLGKRDGISIWTYMYFYSIHKRMLFKVCLKLVMGFWRQDIQEYTRITYGQIPSGKQLIQRCTQLVVLPPAWSTGVCRSHILLEPRTGQTRRSYDYSRTRTSSYNMKRTSLIKHSIWNVTRQS